MTDWAFSEPDGDAPAVDTTGTTPLAPVVESATLTLLPTDDSPGVALDAAPVTITPGAVSVMVMSMVSGWPEKKAGNVIDVTYPSHC